MHTRYLIAALRIYARTEGIEIDDDLSLVEQAELLLPYISLLNIMRKDYLEKRKKK